VQRRIVISAVLAVLLLALQLLAGHGVPAAVATAVIGFIVAFVVLLLSDRWFARRR
jgi:ABC-type sugar transport system substrate-binding protein